MYFITGLIVYLFYCINHISNFILFLHSPQEKGSFYLFLMYFIRSVLYQFPFFYYISHFICIPTFPRTPSRCRWCSGAPVMQRGSSERAAGEELILPGKQSERTGERSSIRAENTALSPGSSHVLRFMFTLMLFICYILALDLFNFELRMDVFFTDMLERFYPG